MADKKIEFKNVPFKIKELDEKEGYIEGYASTFGNVDLGLDVMEAGCFSMTLKNGCKWPVLKNHDWGKQLGWNHEASEDDKGLMVKAKYNMEDPFSKGQFHLAKQGMDIGAEVGLSIGFLTIKSEPDTDNPSIRRIKEVKMMEYSQVTFPMNTQAMLTAVKSWAQTLDLKEATQAFLDEMQERGYSKSQVLELLKGNTPENNPSYDGQLLDGLKNLNSIFKTK